MKIYFTAAVLNKKQYGEYYERIVKAIEKDGHRVFADHILEYDVDQILDKTEEDLTKYYSRMKKRIAGCDLMVAEVSYPSTVNVGHELSIAADKGKPVLALHLKGKKPVLFWGLESEKFFVIEYDDGDLEKMVRMSVDSLKDQQDTRFNFFISPRIANYLDWIARTKRVPRAVYLRRLIQGHMEGNEEYAER